MKILITGTNGLLGQYLVRDCVQKGYTVVATGRGECKLSRDTLGNAVYKKMDITDKVAVETVLMETRPDIIIHAAAMAQPDACELDRAACSVTNVEATRYICDVAESINAKVIYISTDFVFDGKSGPYNEEGIPDPVNYYGQSKLDAEKIVQQLPKWTIVRTILVYGNILTGARSNIVTWVKDNLEKGNNIKVVNDQVRTPTYVEDLSRGILLVVEKDAEGIYHISGKEVFTPYEIALQIADFFGLDKSLMEKVDASVFTQPAVRPLKTGFIIEKAEKELGFNPVSFKEGISKIFQG
ncbi:MAG: SDR family oxidoreductase [Chitinophagaceae bacterium]|nr:SDR family oxidoreductase [Chitinophagaceae bacterium]MCW5928663.1 SDR family oxidoreductase [Chitinophagaceae bacterium]